MHPDDHGAAPRRKFHRVLDQVCQRLLQKLPITTHPHGSAFESQRHSRHLSRVAKSLGRLIGEPTQIDPFARLECPPGLERRQPQQAIDDLLDPSRLRTQIFDEPPPLLQRHLLAQ